MWRRIQFPAIKPPPLLHKQNRRSIASRSDERKLLKRISNSSQDRSLSEKTKRMRKTIRATEDSLGVLNGSWCLETPQEIKTFILMIPFWSSSSHDCCRLVVGRLLLSFEFTSWLYDSWDASLLPRRAAEERKRINVQLFRSKRTFNRQGRRRRRVGLLLMMRLNEWMNQRSQLPWKPATFN